jgi:hypothetical protein
MRKHFSTRACINCFPCNYSFEARSSNCTSCNLPFHISLCDVSSLCKACSVSTDDASKLVCRSNEARHDLVFFDVRVFTILRHVALATCLRILCMMPEPHSTGPLPAPQEILKGQFMARPDSLESAQILTLQEEAEWIHAGRPCTEWSAGQWQAPSSGQPSGSDLRGGAISQLPPPPARTSREEARALKQWSQSLCQWLRGERRYQATEVGLLLRRFDLTRAQLHTIVTGNGRFELWMDNQTEWIRGLRSVRSGRGQH